MQYRPLGTTGITVSAVGFGAWGIGGHTTGGRSYGHTDDAVSLRALEAALDAGITFYDTAPLYGVGHSEDLIGQAFARCRDRVVIATKAGYTDFATPQDFSPAALVRSVDDSLRRLRTDHVDILQLHDMPPDLPDRQPDILDTLARLEEAGKVRCCGASVKSPDQALTLMAQPLFKAFQINFNMLDSRAVDCGLLDRAADQGVGLIARTPLCFGFASGTLTGDETFTPEDHRSLWPVARRREWANGARRMRDIAEAANEQDDGVVRALRYILSFSAISTTIPGMMTPAEVAENAAAGGCPPFPDATLAALLSCSRDIGRESTGSH